MLCKTMKKPVKCKNGLFKIFSDSDQIITCAQFSLQRTICETFSIQLERFWWLI